MVLLLVKVFQAVLLFEDLLVLLEELLLKAYLVNFLEELVLVQHVLQEDQDPGDSPSPSRQRVCKVF